MPVFLCRWPNGDVSFVAARNKEDAIEALDEFDNAELAKLFQIGNFMVDFRLADTGELVFEGFGEECETGIMARAYPLLAKAVQEVPRNSTGELTVKSKRRIAAAVEAEKARPLDKVRKAAETELGKSLQQQLGASSTLVNRRMKDVASRVFARLPSTGQSSDGPHGPTYCRSSRPPASNAIEANSRGGILGDYPTPCIPITRIGLVNPSRLHRRIHLPCC